MIPCAVSGSSGRMGRAIIGLMHGEAAPLGVGLSGAFDRSGSPFLGWDAGDMAAVGTLGIKVSDDYTAAFAGAKVVIDFSLPEATLPIARYCSEHGIALVSGTTGFTSEEKSELIAHGKKIPLLWAPNMSVGVNLLFYLVREAALALGDGYDVELVEAHHRFKKDAPSGTAIRLKEILLEALDRDEEDVVYGRSGIGGERRQREIAIHAMRGGDIVGDHTISFLTAGERIELTHRATSRDTFALGALRAAAFLAGQSAGEYSMRDVLKLR